MEDLLLLLAGAIWLAYKWYTGNQKKKNPVKSTNPQSREGKKPSFFEQLLMEQEQDDEFVIEPSEVELEQKVEPVAQKANTNKRERAFLDTELSAFTMEGESAFGQEENFDESFTENTNRYPPNYWEELKDFDLRKAIIFSEVLNPPYIDYK